MPDVADLLIATDAETASPDRSTDSTAEGDDDRSRQRTAWLGWLGELLVDTRCLALVNVSIEGSVTVSDRSPAAAIIPDSALILARRVAADGCMQRLVMPGSQAVLLAMPVVDMAAPDGASTVLLVLSGALSHQQQMTLLGLARWALKSARWLQESESMTEPTWPVKAELLSTPLDMAQLMNRLGQEYPGSICAMHRLERGRRGQYQSCVLAVSGQSRIEPHAPTVRGMARCVTDEYANDGSFSLSVVRQDSRAEPNERGADAMTTGLIRWPLNVLMSINVGDERLVVSMHGDEAVLPSPANCKQLAAGLAPLVQNAWLSEERSLGLLRLVWRRGHAWRKKRLRGNVKTWLQVILSVAILGLVLFPVEKRIAAEMVVEAAERHALIAPVDGFVKSVQAHAGDHVAKGDLLASLDDKDLQRQVDKWLAEEQKNQQDYLSALALHDRVELSTLRENRALIQTELEQIRAQLARHELRAPVSGVVLSDAVEDALGSAVEAGKILFEVGSAEQRRLALRVPERSISSIQPGQLLSLRMTADPKRRRQARVDTIIPVATASQGRNTFKVLAFPLDGDETLRPGMKGIGKILVGREPRLMQWWNSLWSRCIWLAWKLGLVA